MNSNGEHSQSIRTRSMLAGGMVAGVGSLITMAGMLVTGLSALAATREWVRHLDHSPTETARARMTQARSAALAGWDAWQKPDNVRPRAS